MLLECALCNRDYRRPVLGVPRSGPGLLVAHERAPHALVEQCLHLGQVELDLVRRLLVGSRPGGRVEGSRTLLFDLAPVQRRVYGCGTCILFYMSQDLLDLKYTRIKLNSKKVFVNMISIHKPVPVFHAISFWCICRGCRVAPKEAFAAVPERNTTGDPSQVTHLR